MLTFKPPEFEKTGCPRCDGLRRMTGKPNALCLRHDPSIEQSFRDLHKIPYEELKAKTPKENSHVDSE
ncbi:MAG: hypothetical protein WC455_18070 [Dehalococcoidia bacterium]|jgi:hypothetical protein